MGVRTVMSLCDRDLYLESQGSPGAACIAICLDVLFRFSDRAALSARLVVSVAFCACALAGCADGDGRDEPRDRSASSSVMRDADTAASAVIPSRCYRSEGRVLTRLAPGGALARGWVRLDGRPDGDSGTAQIVESGGATLGARWIRRGGDTLELAGADDFVRLEARVVERDGALAGIARLSSDAQLERSPTGGLVPASREWRLIASAAPCDSAPLPWTAVAE